MNKEVTITTKQIKQAIDDLVDERDELQDKVYKLQQKVNQLEEENKQLKERIEYYYEFDEYLKKEDLPEDLRPYYKNQDCCRYIVELRKENKQLKDKVNQLETNRDEAIEELTYMSTDAYVEDYDIREKHYNLLLSILERGKER